jgi:hypothetical protein
MKVLCLPLLVVVLLTGCGGGSTDSRERVEPTLDYALSMRAEVSKLKKAEAGLKVAIDNFCENLEGYAARPLGTHKDTYDAINKVAQELKTMSGNKAGDGELRKKIDEIVGLTAKLPGEGAEKK